MNKRHPIIYLLIALCTIVLIIAGITLFLAKSRSEPSSPDIDPSASTSVGTEPPYNFDYSWTKNHTYISHAFGGILDKTYTNSYEAFLLNYQLGHRLFEVDFSLTDDGQTVAAHDANQWRENATTHAPGDSLETTDQPAFTYDNFMSSLWYDKYHPVDLNLLFEIMQKYPDIYIITDTKYFDQPNVEQQFQAFVATATKFDPNLLDRFIIQIYKPEMFEWIMSIHPWKSVIYTLYANWENWTPENVIDFSQASGVKFITLWGNRITPDLVKTWQSAGLYLGAHTINNLEYARQLHSSGVNLIYTDYLLPNTL